MALRLHAITLADQYDPPTGDGNGGPKGPKVVPFRDLCAVVSEQKAFTLNETTAELINQHRTIVDAVFKGATVLGINGRKMFETWYQVENFLLSGRLNLEPIVTHHLPLTDFERGLKLMQAGEAIKVVLKVDSN